MGKSDCMILAEPGGKAWDFALAVYNELCKKSERFGLNEIKIKRFRDNEIKVKIKENIRRKNCFFIHDSAKQPAEWFLELALINEALQNASAKEITDVLPYLKFSRQDRKDESRVAINAKVIADVVSLYADRILTADLHSPAIQGFYRVPLDNLYTAPTVLKYMKENHGDFLQNVAIMSPDIGGAGRAKAFAKRLGIEDIVIGYKHRNKPGEVAEFKLLGDAKNKNVLIIDDIVDSGNTLIKAVEKLKENKAKDVYAYCTHGVFSENARSKITKKLDLMLVSDSIYQPKHKKIEVISLVNLFSEAIYRINEGLSLSELFE